jgi:hypothetical protein
MASSRVPVLHHVWNHQVLLGMVFALWELSQPPTNQIYSVSVPRHIAQFAVMTCLEMWGLVPTSVLKCVAQVGVLLHFFLISHCCWCFSLIVLATYRVCSSSVQYTFSGLRPEPRWQEGGGFASRGCGGTCWCEPYTNSEEKKFFILDGSLRLFIGEWWLLKRQSNESFDLLFFSSNIFP